MAGQAEPHWGSRDSRQPGHPEKGIGARDPRPRQHLPFSLTAHGRQAAASCGGARPGRRATRGARPGSGSRRSGSAQGSRGLRVLLLPTWLLPLPPQEPRAAAGAREAQSPGLPLPVSPRPVRPVRPSTALPASSRKGLGDLSNAGPGAHAKARFSSASPSAYWLFTLRLELAGRIFHTFTGAPRGVSWSFKVAPSECPGAEKPRYLASLREALTSLHDLQVGAVNASRNAEGPPVFLAWKHHLHI